MSYLYSASTGGFYVEGIHEVVPDDVIEITAEQHAELMEAQSTGKIITADEDGLPVADFPPAPTAGELLVIRTQNREIAYRNEADPLFFKSQRGEATNAEWLAKIEEIKARFP